MGEIESEESIDVRSGKQCTARDALLKQKGVELAALAKNRSGDMARVSSGLEVSGEAIKMRSEQATTEIDQCAFFFEPVFEHKAGADFAGTQSRPVERQILRSEATGVRLL